MDEKFQAIFAGEELPDNEGMPVINIPIQAESPISESVPMPTNETESPAESPTETPREESPIEEAPTKGNDSAISPEESAESEEDNSLERMWECFDELNCANDASNAKLSAIMSQLDSMSRELSRLAAYDKAVDTLKVSLAANQNSEKNLYKEVEEYKKDTYFTNIKPFLMFLVDMLCEMKKSLSQYRDDKEEFIAENNENSYNEIVGLLEFFIGSFENQMKIQGVDIISFEADSDYITGQQRISKTVKTDDPAKNGKIAAVLSDCYMYGTTVLRPAKVTAYKLELV